MESLWNQTLAELRSSLPLREFTAWIACLRSSEVAGGEIAVEAPSIFHRNWVQQHFLERIRTTATQLAGHPISVSLSVGSGIPMRKRAGVESPPLSIRNRAGHGHSAFTFDTFVVGHCNELAHAGALAVAQHPGSVYNPLFVHGGVGLGKTHLVHAIANAVRQRFRSYRVLSIGAELFVNEMVSAVRRQQMETFHQRFRKIDTLVVDDVQFIAGKERTQEEFLHTFNLLCAAGKQIVLSSDKPPREIVNLEIGLRNRFEGGLTVEVTCPDRDTRRRILALKASQQCVVLSDAVLDYLADRIRAASVRELEGALTRLQAMAALIGRTIDVALAEEVIGRLYPVRRERVTLERVEALVSEALDVPATTLVSQQRNARIVFARQVSMYLLRKQIGLALAAIGERYARDHTTVLHAVRAIEARRACDPEVRRLVTTLEERL
ncbi:MAG: chromosomal replication initiator protein DnaA [Myxococcales bacterium]|jgi:chromosomal replication initiator protein|nr:chromosomal replication initiator protein DnaA [Myxococcales bacterium]